MRMRNATPIVAASAKRGVDVTRCARPPGGGHMALATVKQSIHGDKLQWGRDPRSMVSVGQADRYSQQSGVRFQLAKKYPKTSQFSGKLEAYPTPLPHSMAADRHFSPHRKRSPIRLVSHALRSSDVVRPCSNLPPLLFSEPENQQTTIQRRS